MFFFAKENIYIIIKTCTKHDIELEATFISLQIVKKSPIDDYSIELKILV